MTKYVVVSYIVISKNQKKINKYLFAGFKNYEPTFEPECCLRNYKVYKSEKAAQNVADRLNGYYSGNKCIKSYVESLND